MSSVGPPPLPAIQSERIEEQIFIHPSLVWGHRDDFQAPESHPSPDNEELAHIGDQALSLVVTDLIQVLYPTLRVGPSSKVRDLVKHRPTLAEVSVLYGLHERLRLPERQARRLRASQNVQGTSILLQQKIPSSEDVHRPLWVGCTEIRVWRSFEDGSPLSSGPAW